MNPRVRFAPSPTGFLHIGSARSALFNWLFARHNKGEFRIRVEDTDRSRSKKEFLKEILDSLEWLGLNWDGDVIFQSERISLYRQAADKLLKMGMARKEGEAVIFKIPKKEVIIEDIARGRIAFDTESIKEQVLIKSDGYPAYNFACVIDDSEMDITHVIRGDDHISNTPKQILIYEALGLKIPRFAHMSLIMGNDGQRLSKRHGATSIAEYRKAGYLPEAMINYLALLGWSPGQDIELLSGEELVEKFELEKIHRTSAVFDVDKLNWINKQYLGLLSADEIFSLLLPRLREEGFVGDDYDEDLIKRIIELYKPRIYTLGDFLKQTDFFFKDDFAVEGESVKKHLKKKDSKKYIEEFLKTIESLDDFGEASVEKATRDMCSRLGIGAGKIIHPARVILTGRAVSAGFFEIVSALGKEKTVSRLKGSFRKFF
jgi:glutamyl-tRNA synthetase